jgi:transposase
MTVQRLECKDCGAIHQERVHFVSGKERYTYRMKRLVPNLCRIGTIADVATAYYLKESLRRVWWQENKQDAAIVLDDWIEQARQSGLKPIESIADTLARHRKGILAWYDYRISNGKLEGINNKIKTMKRQAYGYRDMPFFKLKLLSLHDSTYPFSG